MYLHCIDFFGIMPGLDFGIVTPLIFFGIMPGLDFGFMTIELFSELCCRPVRATRTKIETFEYLPVYLLPSSLACSSYSYLDGK